MDRCERFKVVKQGPDGDIYVLTDQIAPNPNEILRLVPARTAPAQRLATPSASAASAPPTGSAAGRAAAGGAR